MVPMSLTPFHNQECVKFNNFLSGLDGSGEMIAFISTQHFAAVCIASLGMTSPADTVHLTAGEITLKDCIQTATIEHCHKVWKEYIEIVMPAMKAYIYLPVFKIFFKNLGLML